MTSLRCLLQLGAFFGDDRAFHRTDLQTNATVNAGGKVNPIPIGALCIFTGSRMDAGNRTGIDAVGNAFAGIRNDRVRHRVLSEVISF